MANRYWIGGSGNWSDPSHWSTSSGGAWGASVPTLADDVFFDNYSHLGPELVLNNTFDSDTWWGKNGAEITISGGVANYTNTPYDSIDGVYVAEVLTVGNRYRALWEVKNYVAGSVVWTDGNGQIGTSKSANGVYESIYTAAGTAIWPMGSSANLALDNIYVREYFSLNVNADVSINCRSFICQPDVSAQILSTTYDVYINGDISLNSNTIFSITNSHDIVLNSQGTSYISIDASVFSIDRMYFNGANAYIFNHDLSAGIKLHSQWQSCDIDFNDYDITCDEIQFFGCDDVLLGNGTIKVLNPYFLLYLCDVSEQNSTVIIRQGSRSNIASIDGARFNNLILDGSLVFDFLSTGPQDVYINNLNITPNSKIKFSPQRADGTRHSYYIKNLTALGTPDSSIILKCTNDGSTSSFIFQESNPYFRIKNAYISDISTSTSTTLYALDSSNAGRTAGIIFTDKPYEYIDYYWVGNGGNWSDVSHWAPTSGGTPAAYTITSSDNLIFDNNSFTANSTVYADISAFKSINMSAITKDVSLIYNNAVYCYGDYILGPGVTRSGNYTTYFYGADANNYINAYNSTFSGFSIGRLSPRSTYTALSNIISDVDEARVYIRGYFDACIYDFRWAEYLDIEDGTRESSIYMGTGTWEYRGGGSYGGNIFNITTHIHGENATLKFNANKDDYSGMLSTFSGQTPSYIKTLWISKSITGMPLYAFTTTDSDLHIDNLIIEPGIEFMAPFADWGHKLYVNESFQAVGRSDASIAIHTLPFGTYSWIEGSTNTIVDMNYCYISDISLNSPTPWYAGKNSVNLGNNTPNIIFGQNSTATKYWVGNGGNWSDVSHWSLFSGGLGGANYPDSSNAVIFDANSFDTSATLHLDVSSFKSIRMTNIDNSIYFMPYNNLYCNGDFVLSPRVEFLFSSYYNFYFYGIGDCSLCTGGINFLSHLFSFKTGNYILYDNLIQYPYSSTAQILLGDDASLDLNNYDIITSSIHEDWDANGGGHLYLRNGMLSTQSVGFYRLRIFPGNSTIKLISNFLDETADQNTTWGDFSGAIKQYNKIWFSGTPNTDYVYNMDVVYPLQVNINILEIDPGIKVKFDANDYGYIKVYNVSTFIAHGTSNASIGIFSKTSDQQFKLNYTGDSDVQADYLYVQDCSATPANIWSAGNHGVDLGNNSGWKFRHHRDIPPVYYRNLLLNKFRYDDVWGIPTFGPELIVNGTFDVSSGWETDSTDLPDGGWYISEGKLMSNGTNSFRPVYNKNLTLQSGAKYAFSCDVEVSSGQVHTYFNNDNTADANLPNGHNDLIFTYGSNSAVFIQWGPFVGTIDNVSLRRYYG